MPSFRIFPSQTSNPVLLHCRADSLPSEPRKTHSACSDCRWSCWGYCCFLPSLYFCVCLNKCQKKLLGNFKNNLGAFKAFPVMSQGVRSHKRKGPRASHEYPIFLKKKIKQLNGKKFTVDESKGKQTMKKYSCSIENKLISFLLIYHEFL